VLEEAPSSSSHPFSTTESWQRLHYKLTQEDRMLCTTAQSSQLSTKIHKMFIPVLNTRCFSKPPGKGKSFLEEAIFAQESGWSVKDCSSWTSGCSSQYIQHIRLYKGSSSFLKLFQYSQLVKLCLSEESFSLFCCCWVILMPAIGRGAREPACSSDLI
jgi:hypothetical protein